MKKNLSLLLFALCAVMTGAAQDVIDIVFNGDQAQVTIPTTVTGVMSETDGANVSLFSMTTSKEYTYRVSGETSDGSLTITGSYKLTLQLAGVNITNAHGGAAIDIQCGKRIAVELVDGTVNTLMDSSLGDQKAAFYFKGHPEFKGEGTLNVTGNLKHAISAKEYIELKKSTGTINVLGAVSDGIHCGKGENNYEHNFFEMKGGTINIANVGSDCIDADDYGTIRIYDGELSLNVGDESNGLKADSVLIVNGGNINIAVRGDDSEGIISRYKTIFNGGNIDILVTGNGSKGIESKRDDNTTTVMDGGYLDVTGGIVSVYATGSSLMKDGEKKECVGVDVDADYNQSGGEISILALGDEVKSHKIEGVNQQLGGRFDITRAPWSVNPHDYQYDMSAYVRVADNGTPLTDYTNIAVGAFIDDICVGVAQFASAEFGLIRIRSNSESVQEVIFKLYDYTKEQSVVLDSDEPLFFEPQGLLGTPSAPILLNCPIIPVNSIILDNTQVDLVEGESVTLTATVTPADATDKTVTWSTSDAAVATVENGVVTAVSEGTATITAKAGDKTATCVVTVEKKEIAVSGITLSQTTASLIEGESVTLTATVTPADATDKAATWTTSDATVATVDNGVVTAKSAGTATITAKAGEKSATCVVTVSKKVIAVSGIILSQTTAALTEGETVTLTATVTPADATDKTVTWTTSDAAVATVENGVVTAKSAGTATITAKAGEKSATCVVTVSKKEIAVSGITLSQTTASLIEGESVTLTATVTPTDATDKTVTWSTSDAKVATVKDGVVTAVAAGTATITAMAGGKSATCVVTVSKKVIAVSGITLSQTTASLIEGESVTLTATVTPADATDKSVTWTTSDAAVVTVENGVVTAVAAGTATITAKAGEKTATCVVTVSKKVIAVSSITLSQTTASLIEGESVTLTATVTPADATDKTVTWATSDAAVATVENGVVTAKSAGTATITAKAGDKSATCVVTVSKKVIAVSGITLSQTTASLIEGESVTLTATVTPTDATDKAVTWTTSDAAVATVENGVVTAKSAGTATITAKAGDKTATCVVTVAKKVIAVSGITLSQTTASLTEGETVTLTATVTPADATDKTVTWNTSDAAVATVENGVVTAKSAGTATITAKAGDKTATCVVTVAKKVIAVSGITLSQTTATLTEGETVTLTATVTPADATDKTVTWSTSDAKVATVKDGVVTAVAAGTATITAMAGGKSATCVVTVSKKVIAVSGITLSQTTASLIEGESVTLTATVTPADATDKTVTWSTSDAKVATVKDGVVTAVAAGTATITAMAGGKSATCVVTVSKKVIAVSGITLSQTTASLIEGESVTLTATVTPTDATDKTVTWATSDAAIATVENGVVTAKSAGTATITAKAGEKSATCVVTVSKKVVAVSGITLSQTTASLIEGESVTLTATVTPADATDKTVTWTTSDAAVATVENGVVTAVAAGTATITAKAGEKSATCVVTVSKKVVAVSGITLSQTTASLIEGESVTLTATVTPADATDKTVTWTTSDAAVATVENGVVTAVAAGTATITAKAGEKTATCVVTVSKKVIAVSGITLSQTTAALTEGQTVTLTATVTPADATDKTVTWSTSDATVATVENGVVTAVSEGTATITAKAGEKTATCVVTVEKKEIAVEGISLDATSVELTCGDSLALEATVYPEDATDKTVVWSSSDEAIACVGSDGVVVALSAGTVIITATSNGYEASCVVVVKEINGINFMLMDEVWPVDVYDMTGRIVKKNAYSISDLKKGIYFINGRKYFVNK